MQLSDFIDRHYKSVHNFKVVGYKVREQGFRKPKMPSVKSHILYPAQALTFHPFSSFEKPHRATAMLRFSALKKNKTPTA